MLPSMDPSASFSEPPALSKIVSAVESALHLQDWSALAGHLAPDVTMQFAPDLLTRGIDATVGALRDEARRWAPTARFDGACELILRGDSAVVALMVQAEYSETAEEGLLLVGHRSRDRYVKTESGWKLHHRDRIARWLTHGARLGEEVGIAFASSP